MKCSFQTMFPSANATEIRHERVFKSRSVMLDLQLRATFLFLTFVWATINVRNTYIPTNNSEMGPSRVSLLRWYFWLGRKIGELCGNFQARTMLFRAQNLGEQSKNLCSQNKLLLLDHLDENISRLAAYEDATFERILSMEDIRLQEKKREFIREWKLRQRGCRDRQVCEAKIEEAALHRENKALDERERGGLEQSSRNLDGSVSEAVHKDVVFSVGPALWCIRLVSRAWFGMPKSGLLMAALIISVIIWLWIIRSGPEWLSCSLTLQDPGNEWWMD